MRLLNTKTLELNEFFASTAIPHFGIKGLHGVGDGSNTIPTYAILSHVWGPEEVTFQEMVGDRKLAKHKLGFPKIRDSCVQARRDGYQYIWIDTCCIDKTSSTELSEAINSMYAWYRDSATRYVFLADVYDSSDTGPDFFTSRWFTRGWTLQELLAPTKLQFFDRDWKSLGTKLDLIDNISLVTKIDLYALTGGDLSRLSVARRMSWVANRQTTRVEDMAYCLLGIFGINMPLLYGEGTKAFIRLQEEILKITDGQSIFAWKDPAAKPYRDDYPEECKPQGLLASSPGVFQYSKSISQFCVETPGTATSSSTNKGLKVNFLVCQDSSCPSELVYMAILSCAIGPLPGRLPGIRLRRLASTSEQYARVDMSLLFEFTNQSISDAGSGSNYQILAGHQLRGFDPTKPQGSLIEVETNRIVNDWNFMSIFVKQEPRFPPLPVFWLAMPERAKPQRQHPSNGNYSFFNEYFGFLENFKYSNDVRQAYPPHIYDPETRTMQTQYHLGQGPKKLGALLVNYKGVDCILILGITYWESIPWCKVIEGEDVGNYSFYPRDEDFRDSAVGITKDEDFRKGDIGYEKVKRDYYKQLNRQTQKQTSMLRNAFDNFNVRDLVPPTDTGTKRHRSVCESLSLVSIVEHTTISGREIYLLRLLFKSEEE